MLGKKTVPAFAPDAPGINPALAPILESSRLQLPGAAGTPLRAGACVGVSSFGFAGSNAHAVVQMAGGEEETRAAEGGKAATAVPAGPPKAVKTLPPVVATG